VSGGAFEAAVVGGGPAGCGAAITLATLGARVVLLEARKYPHDKLCGEFLSPECAGLLEGLGLTAPLHALDPAPIEVACLSAPDGTAWETRLPGVAWGLSRRALDAALAERAAALGVDVRPASTVTSIEGDLRQGFRLEIRSAASGPRRVGARTVIAAHGKRAALDRALGRRFLRRPQPFVALKAHFRGPPLPNRIELHAFAGGYCGLSEFEGGAANVCLLAREDVFQRRAAGSGPARLEAFVQWMQSQNPRLRDWLARAERIDDEWLSIAQVPFVGKRPVVGDVLMAGDAAGLIAPLAGDGIAMALQSGGHAARHTAAFLAGQVSPRELRRRYAADWRREFGARLRLGRFLQAVMLRPRLLAHALRLVQAVPPLGRYLVIHTRDMRPVH
jgi:flavin-dependent dehydrogenase